MSRLARDRTIEPVSGDRIFRGERGQENVHFPCSADHEKDIQSYPGDPYSRYMCVAIRWFSRCSLLWDFTIRMM